VFRVQSGFVVGVKGHPITIEVGEGGDQRRGPIDVVGPKLTEVSNNETRIRVSSALFRFGYYDSRADKAWTATVNGPHLPKRGSASLDLPIAVACIAATGRIMEDDAIYVGELSLSGDVRPVRGLLPILLEAYDRGVRQAFVPRDSARYAKFVPGMDLFEVKTLQDVVSIKTLLDAVPGSVLATKPPAEVPDREGPNLDDIRGLDEAKEALKLAAKNKLNVLLVGPPGSGRLVLGRCLVSLLATPSPDEEKEIASIASASGMLASTFSRPFRAPHHTASTAALTGGGDPIRPGEVTLAHNGVLFLDELPEFQLSALHALAHALKQGEVVVVREETHTTMPARPIVIGSMAPCPCGYHGELINTCSCTPARIEAFKSRIAPLQDLFDIVITIRDVRHNNRDHTPQVSVTRSAAQTEALR